MPESMSYAIATQQSHATGHTPKSYGTPGGRQVAAQKYDKPSSAYVQTADPSSKGKSASIDLAFLKGFSDELQKIAATPTQPAGLAEMNKTVNSLKPSLKKPLYAKPNVDRMPPPSSQFVESSKTIHPPPATAAGSI